MVKKMIDQDEIPFTLKNFTIALDYKINSDSKFSIKRYYYEIYKIIDWFEVIGFDEDDLVDMTKGSQFYNCVLEPNDTECLVHRLLVELKLAKFI